MENDMMMRVRNPNYPVLMLPGQNNGGNGTETTLPKGVNTQPIEEACKPYNGSWLWLFEQNARILGDCNEH